MYLPTKSPLFTFIQTTPILIIIICLVVLPFYLVEHHATQSSPQPLRFESQEIISPITQNQNLRYLTLPNDLTILLINDPDTPISACAIQVNAGSSNEPKEVMGLAHFLEHMLFQGSYKYPANDYFDDFLGRNNGQTNAFTTDQTTSFYFHVKNKAFQEGLDIFSHFFIDAKLDPSAVEREIYAVNNEYQIDLQKNDWRFIEILKKLANKENPFHRFSIGNYKTLKTIPQSMNISVYDELRKFYNTYYSSEQLTICIISNQTLDKMEQIAIEKFQKIPKGSSLRNKTTSIRETTKEPYNFLMINFRKSLKTHENSSRIFQNMDETYSNFLKVQTTKSLSNSIQNKSQSQFVPTAFSSEDLGKFVWYKTLGNHQELSIVFVLNFSINEDPFTRSWDYLTDLISNDYSFGFKNYLRDRGWINNLDAGFQPGSSEFFMYIIKFDLTSDGFDAVSDIINHVFALIGLISHHGVNQTIYNEKSLISWINFLYGSKEELDDELLSLLPKIGVDLKDLYVSGQVFMKFDEKAIKYWLSKMQPNNALFVLGSNDFQINENIERVAFKKKAVIFKESQKDNVWEIYDDFIQEINDVSPKYRLKLKETKKNNSTQHSKNLQSDKLIESMRKNFEDKKKFESDFFNFKQNACLCRNSREKKLFSLENPSNDTIVLGSSLWVYDKKLNKLEDEMKIYYRIEPMEQKDLLQFSASITNFETILPAYLQLYQTNSFIPNDFSLIDNECLMSKNQKSVEVFQQRLLNVNNFTDPINSLINSQLKPNKANNYSMINSTCFEKELQKDYEFKHPNLILKNDSLEVWLKSSREFNLPHVRINLMFYYPNCGFESFMLEMMVTKLRIMLENQLIDAKLLGYDLEISKDSIGLNVGFQGFYDRIGDLVNIFYDNFINFSLDESDYDTIKMIYLNEDILSNRDEIIQTEEVLQQAELMLKKALQGHDNNSYALYLKKSDYNTFLRSIDTFKKEAKLKALFFGNILQNDAQNIINLFHQNFSFLSNDFRSIELSCIYNNSRSVLKIPENISLVLRSKNLNLDDSNHAIINYYQYGPKDPLSILKTRAFSSALNTKAFDFLRTVNQLGYVVFSQPIVINEILGIGVFIQGSKKNPLEMDGLIEDFLAFFENYLVQMQNKDFNEELESIEYDIFEKRNKEFNNKADAYWKEISEGNYNFEKENYRKVLKNIKKNDVLEFYRDLVRINQRKLSLQVWANNVNVGNETLSQDKNFAKKKQVIVNGFDNLDHYIVNDKKNKFYP